MWLRTHARPKSSCDMSAHPFPTPLSSQSCVCRSKICFMSNPAVTSIYILVKLDILSFPSELICLLDKAQLRCSRWGADLWFLSCPTRKLVNRVILLETCGLQGGVPASLPPPPALLVPRSRPTSQHLCCHISWGLGSGKDIRVLTPSAHAEQLRPQTVFSFNHEVGRRPFSSSCYVYLLSSVWPLLERQQVGSMVVRYNEASVAFRV